MTGARLLTGSLILGFALCACEKNSSRGSGNAPPPETPASDSAVAAGSSTIDANPATTALDAAPSGAPAMLAAQGDTITYAVGNPNFRGRTTVSVDHEGRAQVTFERSGKTDRYQGTLSAEELSQLRADLEDNDPREFDSARTTGKPDEARIEITVQVGGHDSKHTYWNAEQWKIPALRSLVERFNQIATTVSGGKVTY